MDASSGILVGCRRLPPPACCPHVQRRGRGPAWALLVVGMEPGTDCPCRATGPLGSLRLWSVWLARAPAWESAALGAPRRKGRLFREPF